MTRRSLSLVVLLCTGGLLRCGGATVAGTDGGAPDGGVVTDRYLPFASANLEAQQIRNALYLEIDAIASDAGFGKARCGKVDAPAAGTIAEVYTRDDAKAGILREKVKGRIDEHAFNLNAPIGTTMDAIISSALSECDAGTMEPVVAAELVGKTLLWFFQASVHHELVLGVKGDLDSPEKWDEAFGYFGRSPDGATSRGLALAAKDEVDAMFGTALHEGIYRAFIAGRNQLVAKDLTGLAATGTKIDTDLFVLLAYYCGREFIELPTEAMPTKELAEGKALFNAIEAFMKSKAPAEAKYIRDQIDATTWANPKTIDAAGIVQRLETVFGIKLKK